MAGWEEKACFRLRCKGTLFLSNVQIVYVIFTFHVIGAVDFMLKR